MGWVGSLSGLPWSQSVEGLPDVLQRLADQPQLRRSLSLQARERYQMMFARSVWLQQLQQLGELPGNGKVCT